MKTQPTHITRAALRPLLAAGLLLAALTPPNARAQQKAVTLDPSALTALEAPVIERKPYQSRTHGQGPERPDTSAETGRSYSRSAVVVTYESGRTVEKPYVAIPILFVKGSAKLLDAVSEENVRKVAEALNEYGGSKGMRFSIEGHASAEGGEEFNQTLSEQRAAAIRRMIEATYKVPPAVVTGVRGFGKRHAQFKDPAKTTEDQLQMDRRVLVVKEQNR